MAEPVNMTKKELRDLIIVLFAFLEKTYGTRPLMLIAIHGLEAIALSAVDDLFAQLVKDEVVKELK